MPIFASLPIVDRDPAVPLLTSRFIGRGRRRVNAGLEDPASAALGLRREVHRIRRGRRVGGGSDGRCMWEGLGMGGSWVPGLSMESTNVVCFQGRFWVDFGW